MKKPQIAARLLSEMCIDRFSLQHASISLFSSIKSGTFNDAVRVVLQQWRLHPYMQQPQSVEPKRQTCRV